MPTYDYQCRQCGRTYEVIHSMLEDGPTTCEQCRGQLRRVFHPAGIIFKGSGFYRTDSRAANSSDSGGSSPDVATKTADAKTSEADGGGKSEKSNVSRDDASPASKD